MEKGAEGASGASGRHALAWIGGGGSGYGEFWPKTPKGGVPREIEPANLSKYRVSPVDGKGR